MTGIEIRELTSEREWLDAYPVMVQLRSHLDEDEYLDALHRLTSDGYRLFGLVADEELVALAGVDISYNMYYGRHVWVYELVTDESHRSKGYGERLLSFLESWGADNGCELLALSSALDRTDAHRFYEDTAEMDRRSYVYSTDLG